MAREPGFSNAGPSSESGEKTDSITRYPPTAAVPAIAARPPSNAYEKVEANTTPMISEPPKCIASDFHHRIAARTPTIFGRLLNAKSHAIDTTAPTPHAATILPSVPLRPAPRQIPNAAR